MSGVPVPLSDDEIKRCLAEVSGWVRSGDTITRTFGATWHECLHFAMYVAAKAQEISHHPDIHVTWQRIQFVLTTHDVGHKLTTADFDLAREIDAIAARRGATPV